MLSRGACLLKRQEWFMKNIFCKHFCKAFGMSRIPKTINALMRV